MASGNPYDEKPPESTPDEYYILDPKHTDPKRLKKEREKASKLKKSQWWRTQLNRGVCHYCENKFSPAELTMDHRVPLARGGESKPGNVVPACQACNQSKKLGTPVEEILRKLKENE
jgi:5-methylcytosine-specific restriction endonuclease McrA